jgi:leader peptidase (prepilin peptidase)/N-methyltransferase
LGSVVIEPLVLAAIAPFVGSFLGVVVQRLPEGRPIIVARSSCDGCGQALRALDLIPLAAWLRRRGRCACGQVALGIFYPGIEVAALAVAISAVAVASGWLLWASLALGWTLLALAAIDLRHFVLPDLLTLPLIPAGLAVAWLSEPASLPDHALGAAAGFAGFALIGWLYQRLRGRVGLGLGDAKLLAGAGAWLGWTALSGVVVIGAASVLLISLTRTLAGGRLGTGTRIAFGPYLALGLWLFWLCALAGAG